MTEWYAKTVRNALSVGMVTLLGCGCASIRSKSLPPPPDRYTVAAESRALNIRVRSETDNNFREVGDAVRKAVEGRLAAEGFRIAPTMFDIGVDLRVSVEEFDVSGEYFRFAGNVDVSVHRSPDSRLLGRDTIALRGERMLGRAKALGTLADQLAQATAEFVSRAVAPDHADLGVEEITIRRGVFTRGDATYKLRFAELVSRLDGVISCRLVDENLPDRAMTFRVVYFRENFPAGLLNRIRLIPELGLPQQ